MPDLGTTLYYIVGVAVVFAALYVIAGYLGLREYLKLRGLRFWERHFGQVTPGPADRERREPFEEKPPEIKPTIPLLPSPVADFTGRQDDIDKLVARLRNRETAAITAIDGQGGVGKTELAYYVGARSPRPLSRRADLAQPAWTRSQPRYARRRHGRRYPCAGAATKTP